MKKIYKLLFLLMLFIAVQDSYAQTAKDKYLAGIEYLMLAQKKQRNFKMSKSYCTKAINLFTEAKSMDFKWADNCDNAITFSRRVISNKGVWPDKDMPEYTPLIDVSQKHITISDKGFTNDTIFVRCVTYWNAESKESGFLYDKYTNFRDGIIINANANPNSISREDTIVVTTKGDNPVSEKIIVTQKASPIHISFCIDGDEKWYSTEDLSNVPEIDVKKFSDEYRSIRLEVYPESERNNWVEHMRVTLPEWCERQTEVKDTRNFFQKHLGIGETRTHTDYGEVYFKTCKQQKKKGTSGISRSGDIVIEFKGVVLRIPIKQNQ